ncbi:MAG: dihydrolipoyl dehydrogenase [Methyloglobulus sp.]|nr:dihydrolipoyl dehydrogenase [Methyloglobulus sp.]
MPKIKDKYDVIIIGAGPSGYASAVKCGQLGLKTLCIDNLQNIPDKNSLRAAFANVGHAGMIALLESAKLYDALVDGINSHGIYAENVSLNLPQMMQRKEKILDEISQDITKIFAAYKVDFINSKAKLIDSKIIELNSAAYSAKRKIKAEHIILATESSPISLSCAPVDNEFIFDSTAALNLNEVPKRLAILGAGVIGLELAGIWNRLGAETILLEAQETFLGLLDHQISRQAYQIFTDQGLELRLGTRVISTKIMHKKVLVEYQDCDGTHAIRVDKLIIASGRKPNSENLSAPEANLLLDENGYVHVNENCRTNLPSVYAIGDLTLLGPMLAHKGMAEGVFVAEQIAGIRSSPINYDIIPNVIYTEPEIAWVGQTEQALKSKGNAITVGVLPLSVNQRAKSVDKTNGMVKIISSANSDAVLGIHIIGSHASELIAGAVLAMEFSASSEDLARTIHSHPSFTEAIREASLAMKNKGLFLHPKDS